MGTRPMTVSKIGIIGSSTVGQTLAAGFLDRGYEVMVGSRSGTLAALVDEAFGTDISTGTFAEVAAWAELVVLAVKGGAAEGVAGDLADLLRGKVVIDVTNPISDAPPEKGVLRFFTSLERSLGEMVQDAAPDAKVVKAWNSVGHRHMVDPDFGLTPTMPICGNDAEARALVSELLAEFGWEAEDLGSMTAARAIEPLCILWCIPGFLHNDWDHVFKLVRRP